MARTREQKAGSFVATDAKQQTYTIFVYQHYSESSDGPEWTPGNLSFKTGNGDPVNRLAKGQYEIGSSGGIILTSDDPREP